MTNIPTKFATIEVGWGSNKGHIYSTSEHEIEYHKSEQEARAHAFKMIKEDNAKMVALLEVKALFAPQIEVAVEAE